MAVAGPAEVFSIWFMTLFFGLSGIGLPLGVPPLPEDPALTRIAPEECLWYFASSGMAVPDASSGNQTEQLFAEPELQRLVTTSKEQILRALRREVRGREERILAEELPKLIEAALTRPFAMYVSELGPPGPNRPLQVRGGLVCHLGDPTDIIESALEQLMTLIPGHAADPGDSGWHQVPLPLVAPPVCWLVDQGYLIIGVGAEEGDTIRNRLTASGTGPDWLQSLRSDLGPERISTLGYLNVRGLVETLGPLLGEHQQALSLLGLDNVEAILSASGLDDVASVSRVRLAIDGEPRGVFSLLPQDPLSKRDLEPIPDTATAAFAVRLDPEETLRRALDLIERFEPNAREEFEGVLREIEREIGVDIRRDVLAALDDTGMIYMPAGELVSSWIGATLVISVQDRDQLAASLRRFASRAEMELGRHARQIGPVVRQIPHAGQTIHYLNIAENDMPFAPAWCVTGDHMVIGLMPQAIKAFLARAETSPSLADVPLVADALAQGQGPACISYIDMEQLVRGVYPLLQIGLRMASVELQRNGIDIDIALLPSLDAIAPHFVPGITTWSKRPEGYLFETRQTLPGGGNLISNAPLAVALLLPAVQSARTAARLSQEMNQLKQLALAFHNFTDAYKHFPNNIYDDEGNPLLSWRVRLLPYLEQQALYEEFHLDEPWDSEHNKALIPRMPACLTSSNFPLPPGKTLFVALAGEKTVFPGNEKISFRDVTDGTSNTIMFVRAAPLDAVVWTKPDDLAFDPEKLKGHLGATRGFCLVAFADGSVQRIRLDLPADLFKALATRDGAEVIDWNTIHGEGR